MVLPNDPFEVTAEQLIEADTATLATIDGEIAELQEERQRIEERLQSYHRAVEGYRFHRPRLRQNGAHDPFANEADIAQRLSGLTLFQQLIRLGILNERILRVNQAARLMHRVGSVGGEWKNLPPRLYTIISNHPGVFMRQAPGEYIVADDAEQYLPPGQQPALPVAQD